MKTTKYIIGLLVLAATAFTACTKEENSVISENKEVTLVTTLSPTPGISTKTVMNETSDGTISTTWEVNDKIWVKYINTSDAEVEAQATVTAVDGESGNATISVTMTDPKDATSITFGFPYNYWNDDKDLKTGQVGTLANIKDNYAASSGTGTLTVVGEKATLPTGVTMTPSICIWKLSFTDGSTNITSSITKLTILVGSEKYVITPSSLSNIYVAISGSATPKFVNITATTASGTYMREKSGVALVSGNFYRTYALALNKVYYFSIGSTKRVIFAPGNLQATYSTSTQKWTWHFAEHQYDYIGNVGGNKLINTPTKEATEPYAKLSADGTVDLFGWSSEATYYGIASSEQSWNPSPNDYTGDFIDWGTIDIDGKGAGYWRTMSCNNDNNKMEWYYLMKTRSGSTINGVENARYTLATINTDGTPVNGMILFPDNYSGPTTSTSGITFGDKINVNGKYDGWGGTSCTVAGWAILESVGCVFLPAAGERNGTTVDFNYNCYASKTNNGVWGWYLVKFSSVTSQYNVYWNLTHYRKTGVSVRLVHEID